MEEKKVWYKTWWGVLLIILFWFVLIPVVIFQSKINNKKKNIFLIIYGIFFIIFIIIFIFNITSTPDEKSNLKKGNSETINTNQIKSDNNVKTENKNSDTQETEKKFEPRIIKNKETGEYIFQIIVPETATHDEIYRALINGYEKRGKDFLEDNVIVVAYSDERFFNKRLLGTHGQYKIRRNTNTFPAIKILPKTENITEEDKLQYLEYLQLVEALQDTGDDLKKSKLEAGKLMKARHPENYSDIIKRAEKYFYGIEKEKTEEEKLKDQINNPDPNSDYQKFKKEQEKKEKSGGNK